jgi:hypothetical protein
MGHSAKSIAETGGGKRVARLCGIEVKNKPLSLNL